MSYHRLMTHELGVEINLHKTLVSEDTFEFAKQIVKSGVNLSAIGPKNLLVGLKSVKGIPSIILDLANKGSELSSQLISDMFTSIPGISNDSLKNRVL